MASLGIFVHSGQGCVCGSRIFVQRGVYDRVVEGIAMMANSFKLGGPERGGLRQRPADQPEAADPRDGLHRRGQDATASRSSPAATGWTARATSCTRPCSPTSTPSMRLYQQEIFGPVVTHPAVRRRGRGRRAGQRHHLRAGRHRLDQEPRPRPPDRQAAAGRHRQVNCQLVFDHDVPFGGYKQSGWGHEFGKEGIEIYLKTKSVWAQL